MGSQATFSNRSLFFDFERDFDFPYRQAWMKRNHNFPFYAITAYLILIYVLQNFMKSRTPMELKKPMFFWNAFLAFISITGLSRNLTTFIHRVVYSGLYLSVCDNSDYTSVDYAWGWIFLVFKFVELGDTLFIVLRKRKLIFLHWYHHVTVLLTTWFVYGEIAAPSRWMAAVNTTVHAFMYSYYAARAIQIKVPRVVAMSITCIQIAQMVIGSFLCIYMGYAQMAGIPCAISPNVRNSLFIMYITYFFLFVNYFYWTYVKPKSKTL